MKTEFEIELEEADEEVLALKEKILELLSEKKTRECLLSLTCCMVDIIVSTAPSNERAVEAIAGISASMIYSVNAIDEQGLALWNRGSVQ
jgi:hypothetical protein